MSASRGEFSSRIGFIMAAAGSAIGLGNIWGFPGQTAQNGGAAFVLVYVILSFIVAYPVFMAELIIGRFSRSNIVGAFDKIEGGKKFKFVGYGGVIAATLIYGFYAIIAGWMLSYVFEAIFTILGFTELAEWAISSSLSRNITFLALFGFLTMYIVNGGVKEGIEKWSARLMPLLLFILVVMIVYVCMQEGAMDGLSFYLNPDFSKISDPSLILSALGQAFFSLSLGVGTMLVYGSYIKKDENLPVIGALVTLADVGIAFLAGFLIIPAMFVAQANGVQIYDGDQLIAGINIAFQVLPSLFDTFGMAGPFFSLIFFALMSIAALTSSISMLEVPVSHAVDDLKMERKKSTLIFGFGIMILSIIIILNIGFLLDLIVVIATQWMQPIIGLLICIFIGYVMNRNQILDELKSGFPEVENSTFYKIWPWFVRIVCPALILLIFFTTIFG